jgi:nicotinamide-nucleotide amidase
MIAEIIGIGNEVVDGSVVNTNASWLAERLSGIGVTVRYHTVVPDEEDLMFSAFAAASQRAQVVLVTGGLGPTVDDFTLEIAAKFFGVKLKEAPDSLRRIRDFFRKLGLAATPNQEKQALLPEGALVLPNTVGTAPGIYYRHRGVHFGFFPGVPAEMKSMYEQSFLPRFLPEVGPGESRRIQVLHCFGLPEGQMDQRLREAIQGRVGLLGAQVGFRVRFPVIDVRLYVSHQDAKQAEKILHEASQVVHEKLGDVIFGEGEEITLARVVGDLLKGGGKTLAVAESCTGGLLSDWITDVPGASDYFLQGVVSYSNQAKIDLLGVRKKTLERYGAVSAETALEMARGIRDRAHADFGAAVTGIAGPSGGTPDKPVGTVHIAVVGPEGEWNKKYYFPFGRRRFKQITAATALDRLRRMLKGLG